MNKTKIKKKELIVAAVFCAAVLFGIFIWAHLHGSTFKAAFIRIASKIASAVAPIPAPDLILPMKFDRQDHALSCEAAALKMLLAYRGVYVDEAELIEKIGFDNTEKTWKEGGFSWGDPQKAFVGDIDGRMFVDGYGVYWHPLARVGNNYLFTIAFENWKISDLVAELQKGNPAVIWGYLGSGKKLYWKTSEDRPIEAVYYEHTFVVKGFRGDDPSHPEGFFVIDPIYGEKYWPLKTFLKKWDAFGRSGIIVFGPSDEPL